MAVVVLVLVAVVVLVLVAVHAFRERQCRFGVRSPDYDAGDVIAQGLERTLQPQLQLEAVHRYDVGFADQEEIARREFEAVGLNAGRHEAHNFHAVAPDALCEVLHRVDARDHGRRFGGAGRSVCWRDAGGRVRGHSIP